MEHKGVFLDIYTDIWRDTGNLRRHSEGKDVSKKRNNMQG